eukprot:12645820-Ditylum_brightwellii.AAC.1
MMRHPAEAIATISSNCPSSSTSIINVWEKAMPVAHQNLLSQQHLLKVDINEDGNLCNEWITDTTSDAAGKMKPVKVFANLVFYNFNKLAHPYIDFPRSMKGKQIKKIPSNDA